MRITQTQEWVLAAVLIAYIAFTPGFQMVRSFLATPIGKAIGLAVIVYVWKYVSALLGLLLTINFVRCAGMREGVDETLSEYTPIPNMPGKCTKKGSTDAVDCPASMVSKATDASTSPSTPPMPTEPATPPPPASAPPMTTPSPPPPPPTTNPTGFTNYGGVESFSARDEGAGAGGCSFSPV